MTKARPRAPNPLPPIPGSAEQNFADGVANLAEVINIESTRLMAKVQGGKLNAQDARILTSLAQAAKALQSGSLWGARAIMAKKSQKSGKPPGDNSQADDDAEGTES